MKIRTAKLPVSLAATALLVSAAAYAGPPDHDGSWRMGPPNAEQRLARMSQELDLNPFIVTERADGSFVVDARIALRPRE